MISNRYLRTKAACYTANISMAVVGNLPPLLFLTFHATYGISYSLLGLLVLVNFVTQLTVDLIFSFFSHKFNMQKAVKLTPVLTVAGLLVYALWPTLLSEHVYAGLVIGTVIFSASGGFVEVLLSPVIAAIPADDPDREMSKLHSIYAWGVVGIILLSTAFFLLVGAEHWQILVLLLTLIPLTSTVLFFGAKIPPMETPKKVSGAFSLLKNRGLWLCVFAIFLGGAVECTMAQWASSYLELAMGIPKQWGDVFGVALFALMLGLGRTLYAKMGKRIERVLLLGASGAALCYLLSAVTSLPLLGFFACAFTGFCASMLWPGTLIVASGRFPAGGVFVFAIMAAGGDLGASVGPQLVGILTDTAMQNPALLSLANNLGLAPEQLGMKLGLLLGMLFALVAIPIYAYLWRKRIKNERTTAANEEEAL